MRDLQVVVCNGVIMSGETFNYDSCFLFLAPLFSSLPFSFYLLANLGATLYNTRKRKVEKKKKIEWILMSYLVKNNFHRTGKPDMRIFN